MTSDLEWERMVEATVEAAPPLDVATIDRLRVLLNVAERRRTEATDQPATTLPASEQVAA